MSPRKVKKPFKVRCPKCNRWFDLTLTVLLAERNECGMCGSHQRFTIFCPLCNHKYAESEI